MKDIFIYIIVTVFLMAVAILSVYYVWHQLQNMDQTETTVLSSKTL
ncbi:hypothetical protein KC845_02815 [Candidatus Kaiserbacteria bacterium]|nr:hypothetical protein [Candidatus Kaiserbacteria bacterium]